MILKSYLLNESVLDLCSTKRYEFQFMLAFVETVSGQGRKVRKGKEDPTYCKMKKATESPAQY